MSKRGIIVIMFVTLSGVVQAQQREKSISAGPILSFPLNKFGYQSDLAPGIGLEADGQYNFTNRSSLLIQVQVSSYDIKSEYYYPHNLTILSLKEGYRYQFANSGFFTHVLAGIDHESGYNYSLISFTLGAGKRFFVKDVYFIDVGIDYIDGDTERRLNIKGTFSILRRPKMKTIQQ